MEKLTDEELADVRNRAEAGVLVYNQHVLSMADELTALRSLWTTLAARALWEACEAFTDAGQSPDKPLDWNQSENVLEAALAYGRERLAGKEG